MEPHRCAGAQAHASAGLLERSEALLQRRGFAHVGHGPELGERSQVRLGLRPDLGRVDEQLGLAARRHNRERQHHGIVGHIRAADVEQPADRIREREHHRILAVGLEGGLQLGNLLLGGLAGIAQRVGDHRALGRGGTLAAPDAIDRVARQRLQLDALGPKLLLQLVERARRVQPGVEADRGAGFQVLADPVRGFGRGNLQHLESLGVHLLGGLQDVAAVDEQGGSAARHHGQAGRAREAREPGQTLCRRRHVLVHVLVGVRHQHGIELEPHERLAQARHALSRTLARLGRLEPLEHAEVIGRARVSAQPALAASAPPHQRAGCAALSRPSSTAMSGS